MIRAIILCCDEQNRKMTLKNRTLSSTLNLCPDSVPSLGLSKSYGDGLNCGYATERFSYSSGQSPSYTNYRMGWSNGYQDCQMNPRYHEGIISTPKPTKWRSRSVGTSTNGIREQSSTGEYVPARHSSVSREAFKDQEEKLSGDSISEWPSFTRNVSLGKDYSKEVIEPSSYSSRLQSEKQEFFSDPNYRTAYQWSSLDSPPSPKDAFLETCEFYGDPLLSREWTKSAQEFTNSKEYSRANLARESNKFHQPYKKSQDCYKSDSKLSNHEPPSVKNSEIESMTQPIERSKSFHDLQNSTAAMHTSQVPAEVLENLTFGISEHDLNRARSVLGLPIREPYNAYISTSTYRVSERENAGEPAGNISRGSRSSAKHGSSEQDLGYNSQPGSRRESINFTHALPTDFEIGSQNTRSYPDFGRDSSREARTNQRSSSQHAKIRNPYSSTPGDLGYRSHTANRRENMNLRSSTATPGSARVSFPSPCITSTHQLTDQSSSYPSSPPSPSRSQSSHDPRRKSQEDQTLSLLKQYYLDAILQIDPQHPLGIKKKSGASMRLDNERNDIKSRINNKSARANAEYKKLWSTSRAENNRLRNEINSLRSDLESANRQLNRAFQESARNSGSDSEKSEKKAMEKKLTEIKEEIKLLTLSGNLTSQNPTPSSYSNNDKVPEIKDRVKSKRTRVKRKRKSENFYN